MKNFKKRADIYLQFNISPAIGPFPFFDTNPVLGCHGYCPKIFLRICLKAAIAELFLPFLILFIYPNLLPILGPQTG